MPLANRLAGNLKRLAVKPLGLRIPPLCNHRPSEIVEVYGISRVPLANRRAVNLKRLAEQLLCLRIPPQIVDAQGMFVERPRNLLLRASFSRKSQ
jgi:hypothetical protein